MKSLWAAAVLVTVALAGCSSHSGAPPNAPVLTVVTSVSPLAQAVAEIGRSKVSVSDVVPTGQNPQTYVLTPARVAQVRAAQLVVEVGDGFQASFEAAASGAAHVIAVQTAVKAQEPDVWLDPAVMQKAVSAIAEAMESANPAASGYYRDGAQAFDDEVNSDGIDFQSTLSTCPRSTIFTADRAFASMAADYGLKDVVIGTGTIGAPAIGAAVSEIAQAGATTVLAETWTSDADVQAVAAVAHVKVRTIDILTGPPAGGWPQSNYIALLESDLGVLSGALGCPNLGTGT